jgi:hypothetical protein
MTLAKELLEKGEPEVFLAYLQSCGNFWKNGWREVAGMDGYYKRRRNTRFWRQSALLTSAKLRSVLVVFDLITEP